MKKTNPYLERSRWSTSSQQPRDDETGDDNSNQYFSNEEKVIRNHLKLNLGLQIVQLIIFLVAVSSFEWATITIISPEL
jgi:hypothetical protein